MPAMIIRCLQHRPKGQNIHFAKDGTAYSFIDDGNGNQIAVVTDPVHQKLFLSIPEGFEFMAAAPEGAAPFVVTTMVDTGGPTVPAKVIPAKPTGPAAETLERGQLRAAAEAEQRRIAQMRADGLLPNDPGEAGPVDPVAAALALLKAQRPDLLAQVPVMNSAPPAEPVPAVAPVASALAQAVAGSNAPADPPPAPAALPGEDALRAMSLQDLRAQHAAETGKAASPKQTADVLVAKIIAAREAKGA